MHKFALSSRSKLGEILTAAMRGLAVAACLLLFAPTLFAGAFVAWGPTTYVRSTGDPVTVTNTFSVRNPSTQFSLHIVNGGLTDTQYELVSSSFVTINGVQVVGPSNFNQNVSVLDVPITLQASNSIAVQVRGQPGGAISIEIIGVDNDPPTISASVSPTPNAAGWNNTNVTVTFSCDDATSGVASCPSAQTIATEGGNQVISGTATDLAGNAASTSVTLNIDKSPPTLTVIPSPAPNANGWNSTDVTVTFTCSDAMSGVASCPNAESVSGDGQGQTITGTATDLAGNTASASVTINLDKTPPILTVSSPASGSTVTSSPVTLDGSASDALSGLDAVACPGGPASLSGTNFTCQVSLVQGANSIMVTATDHAGNAASQTVALTLGQELNPPPNSVQITPNPMSLVVGEARELALVDDYGRTLTGASWTVSDQSVAQISSDGVVILGGNAAGQVTITGSFDGLTAQAEATVYAGPDLPQGTLRWSVQPAPGFKTMQVARAYPVENAPDIFAIEQSQTNNDIIVRALTADGRQIWMLNLPHYVSAPTGDPNLTFVKAVPDTLGGVVLKYYADDATGYWLIRVDGLTGLQSWSYASGGGLGDLAISPDGAIYVVHYSTLLKFDLSTGVIQQQIQLPIIYTGYKNWDSVPGWDFPYIIGPEVSAPMVAPDGSVYLGVASANDVLDEANNLYGPPCSETDDNQVQLLRVSPEGAATWTMLEHYSYDGPAPCIATPGSVGTPYGTLDDVIPDGQGGLLVAWNKFADFNSFGSEAHVAHVSSSGSTDRTMPFNAWGNLSDAGISLALGENGVAFAVGYSYDDYTTYDPVVVSFNVGGGTVNWSTPLSGVLDCLSHWPCDVQSGIVAATEGNGVVIEQPTPGGASYVAQIIQLDSTGGPISTWTSDSASVQYDFGDQWLALGSTDSSSGPAILFPWSLWVEPDQGGLRAPNLIIPLQVHSVLDLSPPDNPPPLIPDTSVQDQTKEAIAFWQKHAAILLDWNGVVTHEPACDPIHTTDCNDPTDYYYEFITDPPTVPVPSQQMLEVFRRFCGLPQMTATTLRTYCLQTGSQLLFTNSLPPNFDGGVTPVFEGGIHMNLSVISTRAQDLDVAHELGHQFNLPHCSLTLSGQGVETCGPSDLMFISGHAGPFLRTDQAIRARAWAHRWAPRQP